MIGLRSFLFSPLTNEGVYEREPEKLAGAIEVSVDLDIADVRFYCDDTLKWHDTSLIQANITLGICEGDPDIFAELLGKKAEEVTVNGTTVKKYISNVEDEPIEAGFGLIKTVKVEEGEKMVTKYRPEFYHKVKFVPFIADAKTKEQTIDITNPTVTGVAYGDAEGNYMSHAIVDTPEIALAFLHHCFVTA